MMIPAMRHLLLTVLVLAALPLAVRAQAPETGIRPLLADKVGDAVCFEGSFEGLKVDVRNYGRSEMEPVPGLSRFGKQVMRPRPALDKDQELRSMTLVVSRDDGGAEAHQPVALGLEVSRGAEVEVLTVLGDLRLGHPLEPETGSTPPRGLHPGAARVLSSSTSEPRAPAQNAATRNGSWQSNVTDLMNEVTR